MRIAITIACVALAAPAAAVADPAVILGPGNVHYRPGPSTLPAGPEYSILYGNPAAPEMFVLRLKLPPGYHLPPHRHERPEIVTVVSGTFHLGLGEHGERSRTTALAPGGFYAIPPGEAHYGFSEGETVIQLSTTGPGGIAYVNPADDPRR